MNTTDLQIAHSVAVKLAAKKRAQMENRPLAEKIDDKGQVTIWHLSDKRYIKVWPVDARDMIDRGIAALCEPGADQSDTKIEAPKEPESPTAHDKALDQMSLQELASLASALGITQIDGKPMGQVKSKKELVRAIQAKTGQSGG